MCYKTNLKKKKCCDNFKKEQNKFDSVRFLKRISS